MSKLDTVMIVGGSGFFGQAAIPEFLEKGHDVVIADLKAPSSSGDERVKYFPVDAGVPHSIEQLRAAVEEQSLWVSHVINTVGGLAESGLTNIFETSADEIERTIGLNLKPQILMVRFFGGHMTNPEHPAEDKSFILMSSINAQAGYSIPFYTAAKGGLEAFIRPAAVDLGRYGIRINAVATGSVVTPSTLQQPKNFEARREAAALKRLTTPQDVTTAFLSCIAMKAFTGQTLVLDCGQSINPSESLYDQRRREAVAEPSKP